MQDYLKAEHNKKHLIEYAYSGRSRQGIRSNSLMNNQIFYIYKIFLLFPRNHIQPLLILSPNPNIPGNPSLNNLKLLKRTD